MEKVFPIMMILVLGLNGLWYWIKFTLKENGYPVSWFWSHFRDIPNMYKLAKSTDEPKKKRKYYSMAIGLTAGIIAFPIVFFTVVPSMMQGDPCEYENRFKQVEWNGTVMKKYNDTPNHNYETIEIQNPSELKKIQNWVVFSNGNFDRIEVGDSIAKNKGETNVYLYKNGQEQTLSVDYGCKK